MIYYEYTDMTGDGSTIEIGVGGTTNGQPYIEFDSYYVREDGSTQVYLSLEDAEILANTMLNGVKEARKEIQTGAEEAK